MRRSGEHKCLFVRQAACDCDHPWGCNIITFPLYTCYCCYSSIQMPRTQAQRCTAPPCYQLWINILNEGKTTPEGDKKHLCCHSPTPAPSSGQRPAAGIQQMGPVPAPLHWQHILFSREYYFSSRPTNTTSGAKNPCLFLFCITFNICGTRAQLYPGVTRVPCPGTGADVIEKFPLPQNIFAADSRSRSVSGAKVCQSRSWFHLRPPTTRISELTTS